MAKLWGGDTKLNCWIYNPLSLFPEVFVTKWAFILFLVDITPLHISAGFAATSEH